MCVIAPNSPMMIRTKMNGTANASGGCSHANHKNSFACDTTAAHAATTATATATSASSPASPVDVKSFNARKSVTLNEPPKVRILSKDVRSLSHVTVHPAVQKGFSEMVAIRRQIHRNPEISLLEYNTAKLVADKLRYTHSQQSVTSLTNICDCVGVGRNRSIGSIEVFEGVYCTGVVGVLKGGKPGPCIALRADMDALAMNEIDSVLNSEYKSKTKDAAHMCGHDGHTATLLGTACVLVGMKNQIAGSIKFIFQVSNLTQQNTLLRFRRRSTDGLSCVVSKPGEEGKAGAKFMIEDFHVLEEGKYGPKVDQIYGLHYVNLVDFPIGAVAMRVGSMMAAADQWTIELRGKGGYAQHTSAAHASAEV